MEDSEKSKKLIVRYIVVLFMIIIYISSKNLYNYEYMPKKV